MTDNVSFSFIAMGDPIVDISAEMDEGVITKYGLEYGQTVFVDENNKNLFKEIERNPNVKYIAGGALENSLRVIAWTLDIKNHNKICKEKNRPDLLSKCTMLGCVGNDNYKIKLEHSLKELGIEPLFEVSATLPTSTCGVVICNKERSLLTNLQASKKISMKFVEDNLDKILSHDVFAVEGYFIKENFETIKFLVDKFKAQNKKVIFTLSATFVIRTNLDKVIELANNADYIFCNIKEAKELANMQNSDNVEEILSNIHRQLKYIENRYIVCTDSEKGAYACTFNKSENRLNEYFHIYPKTIPEKEIVDFNAAGDAFAGGFISELFKGKPIESCIKAGNAASGFIIRTSGCNIDPNVKFSY